MSLIEKALRQAQEPLLKPGASSQAPSGQSKNVTVEQPANIHSWPTSLSDQGASQASTSAPTALMAVSAAVLIATLLLIVGGTIWIQRTLRAPSPAPAAAIPAPEVAVEPPAAPAPEPAPVVPPAAVKSVPQLTGIIEGSGVPYAMLSSGAIAGIGDRIGEDTVTGIGDGAVRVRRPDGTEITLQVPR